jgi:hypothetical protein
MKDAFGVSGAPGGMLPLHSEEWLIGLRERCG